MPGNFHGIASCYCPVLASEMPQERNIKNTFSEKQQNLPTMLRNHISITTHFVRPCDPSDCCGFRPFRKCCPRDGQPVDGLRKKLRPLGAG